MTIRFETRVAASHASDLQDVTQTLELSYSQRTRSRLAVLLPDGQGAAIVLPAREFMVPGDVLVSVCGQERVRILAAAESLMRIEASDAFALMRVVYHLANRHVRAMLTREAVYIEPDTVLADMVTRLGATVSSVQACFMPESGAYAGGHHHHHAEQASEDAQMGNIGEVLSRQAHGDHGASSGSNLVGSA